MYASITGWAVTSAPTTADPRTPQPFTTVAGETGNIAIYVLNLDGSAYDLTGASITLAVRSSKNIVVFTVQGTIATPFNAGIANFPLTYGLTAGYANNGDVDFKYDVWVYTAGGARYQVVPLSEFTITQSLTSPTQQITQIPTQLPLQIGPPGLGLTRRRVTSAATATFLYHHACDPTAGSFTLTMPLASTVIGTANILSTAHVGYGSGNTVTLNNGTDTFNGYSSWTLSNGDSKLWIASSAGYEALS